MICSLLLDGKNKDFTVLGEKDGLIDETEITYAYTEKLARRNNGTVPAEVTEENIRGLARWIIKVSDDDGDKTLNLPECAMMHNPSNTEQRARKVCQEEDDDNDGIVTAAEIIAFHQAIGTSAWTMCCEADTNCTKATEDCQKDAMESWIVNDFFSLARNGTKPTESVSIDECMISYKINNQNRQTVCDGCKWMV